MLLNRVKSVTSLLIYCWLFVLSVIVLSGALAGGLLSRKHEAFGP